MPTTTEDHYGLHEGDTVYRIGQDRWGRRINSIVKYTVTRFTKTQIVLRAEHGPEMRLKLGGRDLAWARVVGSEGYTSGLVYPDSDELKKARLEMAISRAQSDAHRAVDTWMTKRDDEDFARIAAAALLEFADVLAANKPK